MPSSPSERKLAALAMAGTFAFALALRWLLGRWETLDDGGRGPLWITELYRSGSLACGPGYRELYGWLAAHAGAHVERTVFAANAVLGAATAAVAVALGRAVGLAMPASTLLGAAIALDPVAVRASASESYLVPIAFGVAASAWLVARGVEALATLRRPDAALFFAAAGLVVACAARIDRTGWPALALVPLVAFATPEPDAGLAPMGRLSSRLLRDAKGAALAAGAIVLVVAATSARTLAEALRAVRTATQPFEPRLLVPALLLGALLALRPRGRRALFCALPAMALLAMTSSSLATSSLAAAAHHRLFAAPLLVAVAALLPERLAERTRTFAIGSAALVFLFALSWRDLAGYGLDAQENQIVRRFLDAAPPDAEVVHLGSAGGRLLALPYYEGRALGEPLRGSALDADAAALPAGRGAPRYWFRSSLCATGAGAAACARLEASARLRAVGSWTLNAPEGSERPGGGDDPVRVAMFAIE